MNHFIEVVVSPSNIMISRSKINIQKGREKFENYFYLRQFDKMEDNHATEGRCTCLY